MGTAVEDVGQRNRQGLGVGPAKIFIKGQADRLGRGLGRGEGNAENRVRAQVLLCRRAIDLEHLGVDGELVGAVEADELRCDQPVHVFHGLEHALAAVLGLVAVAQFERFMFARARAGGNDGAAARPVLEENFRFKGGVTARVENLARDDFRDRGTAHEYF